VCAAAVVVHWFVRFVVAVWEGLKLVYGSSLFVFKLDWFGAKTVRRRTVRTSKNKITTASGSVVEVDNLYNM